MSLRGPAAPLPSGSRFSPRLAGGLARRSSLPRGRNSRRTPVLALIAVVGALTVGCGTTPKADPATSRPASAEDLRDVWRGSPRRVSHPQSVAVASGRAPLAYLSPQAASIWVTDDTGRQWGPVDVPARSIVRVAEATGVVAGSVRLDRGPLPAGRTYTVYVGVPAEDEWRTDQSTKLPSRQRTGPE